MEMTMIKRMIAALQLKMQEEDKQEAKIEMHKAMEGQPISSKMMTLMILKRNLQTEDRTVVAARTKLLVRRNSRRTTARRTL